MKRKTIAVFITPINHYDKGKHSVISSDDIILINELVKLYNLDVFCEDPLPENKDDLNCPIHHYLIFFKWLKKRKYYNIIYLLWGGNEQFYIYTMLYSFPGIIILRNAVQLDSFSNFFLRKKDYYEYLHNMIDNFGIAGKIISSSTFFNVPNLFLKSHLPVEKLFEKLSKRLILNYDKFLPLDHQQSYYFLPHLNFLNENLVANLKKNNPQSNDDKPFVIAVLAEIIPSWIVKIFIKTSVRLSLENKNINLLFIGHVKNNISTIKKFLNNIIIPNTLTINNITLSNLLKQPEKVFQNINTLFTFNPFSPIATDTISSAAITSISLNIPAIIFKENLIPPIENKCLFFVNKENMENQLMEILSKIFDKKSVSVNSSSVCNENFNKFLVDKKTIIEKYQFFIETTAASFELRKTFPKIWEQLQAEIDEDIMKIIPKASQQFLKENVNSFFKEFDTYRFKPR